MIRILVLEDNALKANKVSAVLDKINDCKYEIAADLVTARKLMEDVFDLLVLDMNLPERFNETPKEKNGISFINEVSISNRLKLPEHIIALTEYEELLSKYKDEMSKKSVFLLKYSEHTEDWISALTEKIKQIIRSKSQRNLSISYDYDIAFITALRNPELDAVLKLRYNWDKLKIVNDPATYYTGKTITNNNISLNVVATTLPQMGMVAAAVATTKVITTFKPKIVIITGICGGIKGKVHLGDIVIADQSFDFGSGKINSDEDKKELFQPDFKPIPLSSEIKQELIELASRKDVMRSIKDSWQASAPINEPVLHIGPMGSGAAVIANETYAQKIVVNQRKLVSIDMETYSIFYACEYSNNPKPMALSVKAVSDYADHEKNDDIQQYCSFISANLADYIIKNLLAL